MLSLENIGFYNFLSLFIGAAMIIACSIIAYFAQTKLFNKYRNKVKNTVQLARCLKKYK